ncbi:RAB6-interacting golgin [Chanos chanos]|uniref:RAB6-interacting golgin n=1 Tax=Chanos chanos TaxID=29144 RepID=A0A6J2V6E7_CHACN|nr:RAB6-interacting golgin [Chanos chanos]
MAAWVGFSDEELRKMQHKGGNSSAEAVPAALGRGRKPAPTNRSRQQLQRERALQLAAQQKDVNSSLPPEQQLTKPRVEPVPTDSAPKQSTLKQPAPTDGKDGDPKQKEPQPVKQDPQPQMAAPEPVEEPPVVVKELDKEEVELREKNRLQQLQWEQRMMEEKNKKRKALLAKTIAEKSKQTQAEAMKLKKIQKELQVLDDSVSNDIGILRKLIEQASLEYSTAWKRFEKAESEYVAAKLDLHRKTEVKEQLTEHLCAIIQQNELRKAMKLEELMQQLEVQAEDGSPESSGAQNTEDRQGEMATQPPQENGLALDPGGGPDGDDVTANEDCAPAEPKQNQDQQESKAQSAPTEEKSQPSVSVS